MKRIRTRLRLDESDSEKGLGLAEVIVAMMIFAIISIAVAGTITNSLVLTRGNQNREIATNVASQTIDLYRSYDNVFDVENTVGTVDRVVGGRTFHVATSGGFTQGSSTDSTTTLCSTGTGALQYFHVTVAVTWDGMGSAAPVYSDTDIAPNSRINNNTQGTIIVSVTGASGAGTSGVTVTATPKTTSASTPTTVTTDAKGCAYLLKVDPGDYTVKISKTNGIDIVGQTAPTQVKTVKAGASIAASFTYDTAATFPLSFPTGATVPTNLTMSYVSTTSGVYSPTTTANPASLFPFADGYSFIAGSDVPAAGTSPSCLSPDPANWSTVASDGAVGKPVQKYAASPGGSPDSAINVGMGVVKVSGYTKDYYLTAVSTSAAGTGDPGCRISTTYTFPKTTLTTSGSGTSTGTMTIALPYGSWLIYQGSSSGSLGGLLGASNFAAQTRTSSTILSGLFILTLDPRTTS